MQKKKYDDNIYKVTLLCDLRGFFHFYACKGENENEITHANKGSFHQIIVMYVNHCSYIAISIGHRLVYSNCM